MEYFEVMLPAELKIESLHEKPVLPFLFLFFLFLVLNFLAKRSSWERGKKRSGSVKFCLDF